MTVTYQDFPACQVATIHCFGDIGQEDKAIQYLFRYWLPRSRYQPANLPGMEIYRRQPIELGWKTFDIDCAVPVIRWLCQARYRLKRVISKTITPKVCAALASSLLPA